MRQPSALRQWQDIDDEQKQINSPSCFVQPTELEQRGLLIPELFIVG
jgi:hypothetical protein